MKKYLFNQEDYKCISDYVELNHEINGRCHDFTEEFKSESEVAAVHRERLLNTRAESLMACDDVLNKLNLSAENPTISLGKISLKESMLENKRQRIDFMANYRNIVGYTELFELFTSEEVLSNKATRKSLDGEHWSSYKLRKILKRDAPALLENRDDVSYSDLERLLDKIQNDANVKGSLFLSIDPAEILTCSENGYDWSSCFSYGRAHAGAPLLQIQNPVGIMYLATRKYNFAGTEVDDKKWRTFVYFDKNGLMVHPSGYPYDSEAITKHANAILKERLELRECILPRLDVRGWDNNTMYFDNIDAGTVSLGTNVFRFQKNGICPLCGKIENEFLSEICGCDDCVSSNQVYCSRCDDIVHEDDASYIPNIDEYWCPDCVGAYGFTCCKCDEVHDEGVVDINGKEYCPDCADTHLELCEGCCEYYPRGRDFTHTEDGLGFCHDCAESCLAECKDCEGIFAKGDLKDDLCESCR